MSPTVEWTGRLPSSSGFRVRLLVGSTDFGRPVGVAECYSVVTSPAFMVFERVVTTVQLAAAYPPLEVAPRPLLSRLGLAIFGDDPTGTGHEEFDRRFWIKTRKPQLVAVLRDSALIADHLADQVPAWSVAGHTLLSWQDGQISDPHQIPVLAARLLRVAEVLDR